MRKYISVVLSHLACGSLSWQLWETNSAWKWKIILDIVKKKKNGFYQAVVSWCGTLFPQWEFVVQNTGFVIRIA